MAKPTPGETDYWSDLRPRPHDPLCVHRM